MLTEPKVPKKTPSGNKRKKVESSTSCSGDEVAGKKIKFDPDYTPKKNEEMKQELNIYKATVKRITGLNFTLQEKLKTSEDKIASVEKENMFLKSELNRYVQITSSGKCCLTHALSFYAL